MNERERERRRRRWGKRRHSPLNSFLSCFHALCFSFSSSLLINFPTLSSTCSLITHFPLLISFSSHIQHLSHFPSYSFSLVFIFFHHVFFFSSLIRTPISSSSISLLLSHQSSDSLEKTRVYPLYLLAHQNLVV